MWCKFLRISTSTNAPPLPDFNGFDLGNALSQQYGANSGCIFGCRFSARPRSLELTFQSCRTVELFKTMATRTLLHHATSLVCHIPCHASLPATFSKIVGSQTSTLPSIINYNFGAVFSNALSKFRTKLRCLESEKHKPQSYSGLG